MLFFVQLRPLLHALTGMCCQAPAGSRSYTVWESAAWKLLSMSSLLCTLCGSEVAVHFCMEVEVTLGHTA
jgi:hypothetical protein